MMNMRRGRLQLYGDAEYYCLNDAWRSPRPTLLVPGEELQLPPKSTRACTINNTK